MLQSLAIRNIAIIDRLDIDFEDGLNVMTGETGAGKTIIAESLGLVLGARAQPDIIRTGEAEAEVAATFRLDGESSPQAKQARRLLGDNGIAADDGEIIIRRMISTQGRGKITINGVPVTAGMLKDIAPHLVDVSSQHEHQLLLDPANHVDLIDDFGVAAHRREAYTAAFQRFSSLTDEVKRIRADQASARERLDFLAYQLDELRAADPRAGELAELEERRLRLKHAATLDAAAREAWGALYENPGSVAEVLNRVASLLATTARIDAAFGPWHETLVRVQTEIEDIAREAGQYAERLSAAPDEIEAVDDRIHLLKALARKHGGTLEDAIARMATIAADIERTERLDDILKEREDALTDAERALTGAAAALSAERKKAAAAFARAVRDELKGLSMGKVGITARMASLPIDAWDAKGAERIELFIAPNVGEDEKPMARIASGGELSRIMLAIKRVMADRASLAATYVFDEVDSGIGGATAEVVGRKLKEVAASRQVICITHLPQVACFGDAHFRIGKRVAGDRTVAEVGRLQKADRVDEIARMLGGAKITPATKAHAEELLSAVMRDT